ncbi:MAG: DUF2934 domain-containing protein [Burkholderiales bacterium]|nr:DUF2934 domain-containing protein [Burkholderiales bacterium]
MHGFKKRRIAMENTEKPKRRASTRSMKAEGEATPAKTSRRKTVKTEVASVSPEMRQKMIEDAAYYRAQQNSDGDLANWLAAEAEIDRMLGKDGISG